MLDEHKIMESVKNFFSAATKIFLGNLKIKKRYLADILFENKR